MDPSPPLGYPLGPEYEWSRGNLVGNPPLSSIFPHILQQYQFPSPSIPLSGTTLPPSPPPFFSKTLPAPPIAQWHRSPWTAGPDKPVNTTSSIHQHSYYINALSGSTRVNLLSSSTSQNAYTVRLALNLPLEHDPIRDESPSMVVSPL